MAKYTKLNTGIKSKRTGKNTVALVGFAQTSRDQAPWDDPDTEIWCLNETYVPGFIKRSTRWFQMHTRTNFSRSNNLSDPDHYKWLQEEHGFPIYMQHHYKEIPDSVRYPLNEVIDNVIGLRYSTSTFGYMMALAIYEGFERIELYGFEMRADTEYFYQRPNAEYMIGVAMGKGIEVYLPPRCNLLSGTLYGYEKMSIGFRQGLELQKQQLMDNQVAEAATLHRMDGGIQQIQSFIEQGEWFCSVDEMKEYKRKLVTEKNKQQALLNLVAGEILEVTSIIDSYDKYPFELDAGDDGDNDDDEGDSNEQTA